MEAYIKELKKRRAAGGFQVKKLPVQKRGRPLLLGEKLDRMLQACLKRSEKQVEWCHHG